MPQVRIVDGEALTLREIAPGVFRAMHPCAARETVKLVGTGPRGFTQRLCSDATAAVRAETQVDPRAALPMAAIAGASGGAFVTAGEALPTLGVSRTGSPLQLWPVWPWFVLLSLVAFLLDVLHRRRAVEPRRSV